MFQMFEDLVKEAIRAPSEASASAVMGESVPQEVQGFIPSLLAQLEWLKIGFLENLGIICREIGRASCRERV